MLGKLFLVGLFLAAGAAVAIWSVGLYPVAAQDGSSPEPARPTEQAALQGKSKERAQTKPSIGGELYTTAPASARAPAGFSAERRGIAADPIVIANSRLALIRMQEVPSQRDGVLQFIGIEVKDDEKIPTDELVQPPTGNTTKKFRRLKEGDNVEAGQLLSVVDDSLARAEYAIKNAKVAAAQADQTAAEKTRDEALKRYDTALKLWNNSKSGAISYEDVRGAELTHVRYIYEAISKKEAIAVASQEMNQASKTVEMHEIRSKIPGRVKRLYKHEGEAVKALEPVLLIHNPDLLRVEGTVEVQYRRDLREGMDVVIEPTYRENADQTFSGHRLDINSVAVSKDPAKPLIVSGSEDGTIMVWERASRQARRILSHPAAVRAVACTQPGSEGNWCLSGAADGKGRLWDLDGEAPAPLREMQGSHRGAITAVTFAPDGRTCATAGEDVQIMLWDTSTGALRYKIAGHRNVITALYFTPDSHLISASRDNTVRLWKLGTDGAQQQHMLKRRSSDVALLGVTSDGKHILDEQGKEMRILTFPGGITEAILQTSSEANPFRTLAIFSPDSRLALTSSGSDGVLQLWRIDQTRSSEVRQLIPGQRSAATCAAFSPDGSFVVGGIRDGKVYVWPVPSAQELNQRIVARITNIEQGIESSESKVRIQAELTNPANHPLLPGDIVTMVAYPQK